MNFKILDVPTTSISEVKKSPTIIFKKAEKENTPVYVFNRGDVAGVMLTQEQYESLTNEIEVLHERVLDLEVEKRLVIKDLELYSDEEVRGANADQFLTIDENDGWEQFVHKIEWTALSKQDYDSLDGSQKIFVDKGIVRIKESGMQA